MNYPTDWRIKIDDFKREIESCAAYNTGLRKIRAVDTDDSVFNEWLLENHPQPYVAPPTYEDPEPPRPRAGRETVVSQVASNTGSSREAANSRPPRRRSSRRLISRQRQPIPATVRPAPSLRRPVPSRRPR